MSAVTRAALPVSTTRRSTWMKGAARSNVGARISWSWRRLAYASVTAPTLYVFLGVVQALVHSPIPDEIVWCVIWLAIAIWSQRARNPVAVLTPAVGRWRVVHGLTAAILCLYVLFH